MDLSKTISETAKNIFLAGVGAVSITADTAQKLTDEMIKQGKRTVERGKAVNEELKHDFEEAVNANKEEAKPVTKEDIFAAVAAFTPEEMEELKAKLNKCTDDSDAEEAEEVKD